MTLKKIFLYNNIMDFGERHQWVKPLLPLFFRLKKKAKKLLSSREFYFEVTACEHCNLQCAMCSHYSPLAAESFTDTEELDRDLTQLNRLFKDYHLTCCILGGEPLLHPDIAEVMQTCRKALPSARLQLCTNGLLLKKMDDRFWQSLHDNDVQLIISSYPVKIDYEWIMKKAAETGVEKVLRENAITTGFAKGVISPQAGDSRHNAIMCDAHHRSHTLWHGKLYTCHCSANIHLFNSYFHTHYPEDNGVDIYGAETARTLLRKMEEPCALCAHCRPDQHIVKPWSHSKKDMYEWLEE